MALSAYQRFCITLTPLSRLGKSMAKSNPEMEITLAKANKSIHAEVYYTVTLTSVVIAFFASILAAAFLNLVLLPPMNVDLAIRVVIWVILPIVGSLATFGILLFLTKNKASDRKKNIDRNLSYATNYMAAMASADVTPSSIFRGLAQQEIYGEIQKESEKIARDIDFFGKDIIKVLQKAIARSPSVRFQDFLQGIITTSNSGGSLKVYFMSKSEQFMRENKLQQERDLQSLGVMAESFVTVVVAAPLFLIIMMATMTMMGQAGGTTFLYSIIFGLIPVAQIAFAVLLGDSGGVE